ncbi:hypothetical protein BJV77DRAFT_189641 [Russula vinacea]|nr:hypothetical protein BJV77DRAFT_189641 [Russula vinacea]
MATLVPTRAARITQGSFFCTPRARRALLFTRVFTPASARWLIRGCNCPRITRSRMTNKTTLSESRSSIVDMSGLTRCGTPQASMSRIAALVSDRRASPLHNDLGWHQQVSSKHELTLHFLNTLSPPQLELLRRVAGTAGQRARPSKLSQFRTLSSMSSRIRIRHVDITSIATAQDFRSLFVSAERPNLRCDRRLRKDGL